VVTASWRALGTEVHLTVLQPVALETARAVVEAELSALDVVANRFREDSELSALNRSPQKEVPVSSLMAELLLAALRAARLTSGLVDPTVGTALIEAGYDRDFALIEQDGGQWLHVPRPVTGWRSVELDFGSSLVRRPPGTILDLGATAKAWVADQAAWQAFVATGSPVVLSIGGDVALQGVPPLGGWAVEIVDLPDTERPRVLVDGGGVATSGTTIRRWRRGGKAMHHIIDPLTGAPSLSRWRTVTVHAGSCLDANIAATAAILLGDSAPQWLEERRLPARLVDSTGAVYEVGGWPRSTPMPERSPQDPQRQLGYKTMCLEEVGP
jgi:thiamine biosynthesis lipoprotein